jgi:hypothetical protein
MRLMLSLLLSVLLAFAAQSEVVARSEMAGSYDQVVCGANGAQQVTLDAAGHVVHRHPCTHCLAASIAAADTAMAGAWLAAPLTTSQCVWPDLAAQAIVARLPVPLARAPPLPLV